MNRVSNIACCLLASLLAATSARAADELYFQDDFSAGSGQKFFYEGNLDERSFGYRDGTYQIDTRRSTAYGQSVLTEDLDSYRIEATCQLGDTTDINGGGFGLSFNYQEGAGDTGAGSDFLLFLVYDRGAYTILRYHEGRTSVLYQPTKTKLFKAGDAVRLMVDVRKGQARCFINGGEVASIREDVLKSGGFGLFATAQSKVLFDDFRVFAPPVAGGAAAAPTPVQPSTSGFSDDFSGPKTLYDGTYNEVSYSYSGGRYVVDTLSTSYIGLSPFPQQALNFDFSADVELLDGDSSGSYGLYFRDYPSATPDKPGAFSQFRFLISPGWFAVEQSIEDRPLALAEWTETTLVKPGVNRLKVVADGGSLSFFINDEWVYSFLDARPHTGEFGLFASAGVKAAFDNVAFTKLP